MKTRTLISIITAVAAFAAAALASGAARCAEKNPQVEVVFVLDTTGSMSGLIEGAKLKIWSIANQIIKGSPRPDVRMGLVGYRDVGDDYVTRVFDLSADLDDVYAELTSYQAGGGGDGPEHVNRALHDAVNGIDWSSDDNTVRIIFLVGDAPPHVDYHDGYDYKKACARAAGKDIVINTIQCGQWAETVNYWREIALLGEGEYAAIEQTGGMRSVPTPMDEEISRLSDELRSTVVVFGAAEEIARKERDDVAYESMAPEAKAARASVRLSTEAVSTYDLIDGVESGRVQLDKVEAKDLPEEMRSMNLAQKQEYLDKKVAQRNEITKKLGKLNRERDEFVRAKLAEEENGDSFDAKVLSMIRTQAVRAGIKY